MSKKHNNAKNLEKTIKMAHVKTGRLLRNNVGAYQKGARWIQYGLGKGSSDLIGWTTVEITEEMIGQKIAVFTAVELKTEKDRASPEQINFVEQVHKAGGLAGIVYNEEEYKKIFENFCK
jgi:hypothetical protein